MKKFNIAILGLLASLCAFAQQNTIVQTSLSAAITSTQTSFAIASATGVNAPSFPTGLAGSELYVVEWGQNRGEEMQVTAISGTTVSVRRTAGRTTPHASGAMVLVATNANWFYTKDPQGSCVAATTYATPWVNVVTGNQWLCSTVTLTWVPGWGNTSAPPAATTAVASAVGLVTPSGPLFHTTGTSGITGFNIPIGYNGGPVCIIPDGILTTTNANNLAIASTTVVSKVLCYQYDKAAAKPFFPSY